MKILRSWLNDYIKITVSDDELADKLSMSGTSVESIVKGLDENVVVAEIIKVEKHPDADRLNLASVTDGTEMYQVVCGAPNIAAGQRVPFAKIGAKLPEFEIKKTKIRGVESFGMLCAPDELGLGEDHSGILQLPKEYELGKPLKEYFGRDSLFDIEVTPNRGDCLSHIGVAREVAALTDNIGIKKEPISLDMTSENANDLLTVEIKGEKLCPQYLARVIKHAKIGPSPKWLQDRLIAIGAKPINNIVDVTNYILFDLGQPLHAFDMAKIKDRKIIIRTAETDEEIKTLDGTTRKLDKNMLVIADSTKAVAVAGVMGGENSEVTNQTVDIVIEAAEFNAVSIRKTAKKLGLSSEASYRFERGIDSSLIEYALNKAAKLMAEVSGGRILNGIVKAGQKPTQKSINIEYQKINSLLGLELSESEINHILKKIGFETKNNTVVIPLWRHDISIWQDLAEEVGRIYGYGNIKSIPVSKTETPKKSDYYKKEKLKDILVDLGFSESYNYAFLSSADIEAAKIKSNDLLEVANPLQPENKYLRNSLIPALLKNVAKNPTFDPVLIFEVGHIFTKSEEINSLGITASGKGACGLIEKAAEKIAEYLNLKANEIKIVELSREELQRFKIKKPTVYTLEIDLDSRLKKIDSPLSLRLTTYSLPPVYRPFSKYPSVTRDLAFIVDRNVKAEEIKHAIYSISDNINRVELFDEFASDKFGVGKKNVAYHLYLEKMDKTMTDDEANEIIKKVVREIKSKFNGELRN